MVKDATGRIFTVHIDPVDTVQEMANKLQTSIFTDKYLRDLGVYTQWGDERQICPAA